MGNRNPEHLTARRAQEAKLAFMLQAARDYESLPLEERASKLLGAARAWVRAERDAGR